jgi:hypothetical protein
VVVVVLSQYVLSTGPAQYLYVNNLLPDWVIVPAQWIYLPLSLLPAPIDDWIERYADWFAHALP